MSKYRIEVRGACAQGSINCDCFRRHRAVVDQNDLPPFHDGCTCAAIDRLDEVRQRLERNWERAGQHPLAVDASLLDIGYLLRLLGEYSGDPRTEKELLAVMEQRDGLASEVRKLRALTTEHPADELPDDCRRVLVRFDCGDRHVGWYEHGQDVWYADDHDGQVFDVASWHDLPPIEDSKDG